MSNMSYCRFENTSKDLGDCVYALETLEKPLSVTELDYAKELILQAAQLLELLGVNAVTSGLVETSPDFLCEVNTLQETLDRMQEYAADSEDDE